MFPGQLVRVPAEDLESERALRSRPSCRSRLQPTPTSQIWHGWRASPAQLWACAPPHLHIPDSRPWLTWSCSPLVLALLAYVVWLLAQGTGTPGLGVRPLSGPAFLRSAPEFPSVFFTASRRRGEAAAPSAVSASRGMRPLQTRHNHGIHVRWGGPETPSLYQPMKIIHHDPLT